MSNDDPICGICHEPKSLHVKTDAGPFTHPREARGEGTNVLVRGPTTLGRLSPADDDIHCPPVYKFQPTPAEPNTAPPEPDALTSRPVKGL